MALASKGINTRRLGFFKSSYHLALFAGIVGIGLALWVFLPHTRPSGQESGIFVKAPSIYEEVKDEYRIQLGVVHISRLDRVSDSLDAFPDLTFVIVEKPYSFEQVPHKLKKMIGHSADSTVLIWYDKSALMAINWGRFLGEVSPAVTKMVAECGAQRIVTATREWK